VSADDAALFASVAAVFSFLRLLTTRRGSARVCCGRLLPPASAVPSLYSSWGVPLVCCGKGSAIGRAKHEVFVRMCVSLLRYVQYVKVISAFLPRDAMHPRY